jgi:hypothetical protein
LELVKLEIQRYDWDAMRCGCQGSAGHLAHDLMALAQGMDHPELIDHVVAPGEILVEPSLPTLAVSLAAVTAGVTGEARDNFFGLVLGLIGDNGHASGMFEGRDPVAECRELARTALWTFYAEVLAGPSEGVTPSHAFEIVSILEENSDSRDRVLRVQAAAAERLPWDLRPPRDPFKELFEQ